MTSAVKKKSRKTPSRHAADPEWKDTLKDLRQRRRRMRQVAKTLNLGDEATTADVIQDFLMAEVFRLATETRRATIAHIQKLQALLKLALTDSAKKGKRKSRTNGADLAQQLEQIYGPGVVVEESKNAR